MAKNKSQYDSTLNLPKTLFEMRAGLPKKEPVMLKDWDDNDLYNQLMKHNEGKPQFILHDGPPYANGNIHMGTALNKIIKDIIIREKNMEGYQAPYVPGFDTHGLPIELKALSSVGDKKKDISKLELRQICEKFATEHIDIMSDQFKRLGVIGDFEHPYLTLKPEFEARQIEIFGEMAKKGYIYKGLKPVYWCPHDETALAEAEIEYQDDPCTTVYVKFPMNDDLGKLSHLDKSKLSFVIWTTTIWTLPGNLAIALHPSERYAVVKNNGNGEMYIMAEALTDKVMGVAGISDYEIVETHEGAFFENMLADHPFLPKTSRLVLADYVTMDSGTGCVHTAPGFGADDYQTCLRYGMDMVVPVDDQGRHTDYAGKYAGMKTEESNPVILQDMKEAGSLFASEEIVHSYPHCWRCKKPIIFRATPQWFCSVESFKDDAIAACEDVRWVPSWGKDRLRSMVLERTDWCISRQRRWGLPIPVFYCKDCGKPICTDETIDAIANIFEKKGSNAWFEMEAEDMLPEGFTCPHCGKNAGFEKESDTLDGWFDSGSTHYAAMERDQGFWPATMYIEGLDQYRGWFQSSLLVAVGALGRGAPFKECLTHGWTVDGQGRAMHKSLGNGMDPAEIFNKYGADLLRLWAGSSDYHVDVRCSDDIFKQLSQNYLKFRNTAKFCLDNLTGFDPEQLVAAADMQELDRWAVTRLNSLIRRVFDSYDAYEFHAVSHAINDFCVVDLSSFYFDIIKDRLYCDGENSASRRSAQTALFLILDAMTRMFAPILAFTCEEIWLAMPHRSADDSRSVLFNCMVQPYEGYALPEDAMDRWARIAAVRSAVNGALETARAEKKIGKSLEAEVDVTVPAEDAFLAELNADTLADLLIVSQVRVTVGDALSVTVAPAQGVKCARCWKVLTSVGTVAGHDTLCPRGAAVVKALPVVE